jgi:hypothetical protein
LLLAACGGDSGPDAEADPKGALSSAFENWAEAEGSSVVGSIQSDAASLAALAEDDGDSLTDDEIALILDSTLTVTGRNAETVEDTESEIVFDLDGDLVEVRALGQDLFLRADVRALVERFGASEDELDQFIAEAPPGFEFVEPAADGEWIALEGLQELTQQLGGITPDPEKGRQLNAALLDAIEQNSTVTSEGEDDVGNHLVAVVKVRPLYEAVVESFQDLLGGSFPGAAFPPASEVPDEEVRVDVWVADDQVRQIEFDFIQLGEITDEPAPEGVERFAIRIGVEEFDGSIERPEAATSVDLAEIFQNFFGGLGGMTGEESAGSRTIQAPEDICEQLEGAPPEVVEQFADECPELQG